MSERAKTLLLVEDEVIIAFDEKLKLERYGYRVKTASSGEAAIEAFRGDGSIDLVLMDIDLGPGIDGIETASTILGTRDIPVLFLSSHVERELVERTEEVSSFGYVVKNSGITVLDASIKMAFKLFAAQEALRRQNTLMAAVMENAPIGFAVNTISDGKGFLISGRFEDIYGIERGGLSTVGDFFEKVYSDPAQREAMRERILGDMASGDPGRMRWEDIRLRTRKGEVKVLTAINIPVIEHDLMVSTVQDVTERWKAEQALRASEQRFRGYVENASDIVYELSPEGRFTYISPNWLSHMGEPSSAAVGSPFEPYVHPEDIEACKSFLAKVIGGDPDPGLVEYRVIRRDGTLRWHSSRGAAIRDAAGAVVAYLGIGRDVTEDRELRDELRRQLRDKETLLKEAYHRIKNHLASVEALLAAQADSAEDPATSTALLETKGRIASMTVLYQRLLSAGDEAAIQVRPWLESIVGAVAAALPAAAGLEIRVEAEDCRLGPRQLFPLGIAVNELVTNAAKHAFDPGAAGARRIEVGFVREGNWAALSVRDNGRGWSQGPERREGFGLALVGMLAKQLSGSFDIGGGEGTRAVLRFPPDGAC